MGDEGGSERYHLALFDGTNFNAWKFRMQVLLEEHDLMECVEEEIGNVEALKELVADTPEKKAEKKKLREQRLKKDRRCKSLIISRIHDSQLEYVQEKKSPKEVWDALRRVFERKSIASRMHLKRKLLSLRFEGGNLQEHFLCFDRLVREYRNTGAEMGELDIVCHLLLTLGPSYSTVVTALETMPEENLNLEFVKCRLLDEEVKRRGIGAESFTPQDDAAAFSGSKKSFKKKLKCYGCNKEGHKQVDCPEKKKKKQKQQHSAKANLSKANDNSVCFVGVRDQVDCREDHHVRWYLDSGASDHLVKDRELFTELHATESTGGDSCGQGR